jgi:3'-phosphoadenosine 5'-phosphosulfate sulfotransferase (PAPS reductase)/FAD synthetase
MTHPAYRDLPTPLVISFSGGRSSAYMLWQIVEANGGLPDQAVVNFNNTGFELPETLDFIQETETRLGIHINWLEYKPLNKFTVVNHNSAARNGEPFIAMCEEIMPKRRDGTSGKRPLPNPVQRHCTGNLKIRTSHRYLRSLGWTRYYSAIGYRADEEPRVNRRQKLDARYAGIAEGGVGVFPMFHAGVVAEDIFAFWDAMPYDLRINSWEGNCDYCFMKSTQKLKDMYLARPERIKPWLELEAREYDRAGPFRKDRASLAEIVAQVEAGDLSAPPQDPDLMCNGCTG